MREDSRMYLTSRQADSIDHDDLGIQAFKRKHNGADK